MPRLHACQPMAMHWAVTASCRYQAWIQKQADGSLVSNGYIYNITDQVELKHELQEARKAAETANAAKSRFLATISHEIRTPVSGVISTLELLEHSRLDDSQRENLGIVRRSSELPLRLLNDILDFSKIEAGKVEPLPEPVSLRRKLEGLYQLDAGYAAGKGISLRCSIDPELSPVVMAGPQLLRQILSNLLSNAIKFTKQGSVTIAAELVGRNNGIETVRLSAQDTGVGIMPEDQARLFAPFTQIGDAVECVADGEEALRKWRAGGIGLILTDCNMPGMDGYALTRAIRAEEERKTGNGQCS